MNETTFLHLLESQTPNQPPTQVLQAQNQINLFFLKDTQTTILTILQILTNDKIPTSHQLHTLITFKNQFTTKNIEILTQFRQTYLTLPPDFCHHLHETLLTLHKKSIQQKSIVVTNMLNEIISHISILEYPHKWTNIIDLLISENEPRPTRKQPQNPLKTCTRSRDDKTHKRHKKYFRLYKKVV